MKVTKIEGTVAWATTAAASDRETLTAAASEFNLDVQFCPYGDALRLVRAEGCDVIGVELDDDREIAMRLLKDLRERLPRVTVFAASADTSISTLRAALEAGAQEMLSLPLNPQELNKAFVKFTQLGGAMAAASQAQPGEVVTVCGVRGGLGVTTIAVNLAVRISGITGVDTALVDLDLQRGDVAAFLNLSPLQSIATISSTRGDVDEIFLHGTMTRHPSGVYVLPAPSQMDEADVVSQDDVGLVLGMMRSQFRYVIVDTPRTITGGMLAALENSDRVLLLTDLSVPGVRAAQRTVELFIRLGLPSTRVDLLVTNTVPGPVALKDAVRAIGKEPLLIVPRDEMARESMNAGAPLNGGKPSPLVLTIADLARKVTGSPTDAKAKRGRLLRRFFTREANR